MYLAKILTLMCKTDLYTIGSKVVAVLNEIGLIYSESLPRINKDGKWRTDRTVFCNAYKREGGKLLDDGSEYYISEIDRKKRKLKIIR